MGKVAYLPPVSWALPGERLMSPLAVASPVSTLTLPLVPRFAKPVSALGEGEMSDATYKGKGH